MSATPSSSDLPVTTARGRRVAERPSGQDSLSQLVSRWRETTVDVVFVIGSLVGMLVMQKLAGFATIPYHLVFVLFVVVYGYRVWSLPVTVLSLAFLVLGTGAILIDQYVKGQVAFDELSEIVLMPTILAAMAWHARRRATLMSQVERLHRVEHEHRLREHEFARDTAHALRTPLTIARGHVELMTQQSDDEQLNADAHIVLAELDRLAHLAGDLLAITELEQRLAMTPVRCDLTDLVSDVFDRWSATAERDWRLTCDPGVVGLADAEVARRCLDAMVENALKSTDSGGIIHLLCRSGADVVTIGVADDGPGIEPQDRERVFRRFWRSGVYSGGTGLGLSYVKAAAQAHAGDANARRSSEGGAEVTMTFPRVAPSQTVEDRRHRTVTTS